MKWESTHFLGGLVLALAVGNASAATVDLTWVSINPSGQENVSTDGGASFKSETTGQFNFTAANPTGAAAAIIAPGALATWCIELDQYVSDSVHTYSVLGPAPISSPYVAPFTNVAGATSRVGAFFNQYYSTSFTTDQAVAFQLDIWELVYDPTPGSLGTGTFRVDTVATDQAFVIGNNWLAGLNVNATGPWSVYQLHHDSLQDEIFAVQGGGEGQNPTPLPAAVSGGIALLAGLALLRAFRRRAQA